MSSIKDKPLKKIVCDKRVTIDFLHINKINNINKNNDKINVLETKINKIQKSIDKTNIKQRIDTENKLLHLQNEYNKSLIF